MDQSVWIKAASTAQQQTPGGSFEWQDLLAPAIGGLIGAGSSYLLSDRDDGEIIYDKYGRPVGREESSGLGKALLGVWQVLLPDLGIIPSREIPWVRSGIR